MQDSYFHRRILDPCQERRYCGQESKKNQEDSGRKYCIAWRRDDFSEEVLRNALAAVSIGRMRDNKLKESLYRA